MTYAPDYASVVPVPLRWSDMDAYGHVKELVNGRGLLPMCPMVLECGYCLQPNEVERVVKRCFATRVSKRRVQCQRGVRDIYMPSNNLWFVQYLVQQQAAVEKQRISAVVQRTSKVQ